MVSVPRGEYPKRPTGPTAGMPLGLATSRNHLRPLPFG
jgi:hypothetical protein